MNILDSITRDLDWREAEIASIRIILFSGGFTPIQKQALLRAAWALLYAHYEGFCKNTLFTYYDFVSSSGVACENLPDSIKLFALGEKLKQMKNMKDEDLLEEITNFKSAYLSIAPGFPEVDTRSNLWPSVLIELMETADLNPAKVIEHDFKLKTLVSRRNKIAHGENNIIAEVEYYKTYEDIVYDIMYDLAMQVDEKLASSPFIV